MNAPTDLHARFLRLAAPNILANLLVPLASAIDTVTTATSRDIVADRREAAAAVRRLRSDAIYVYVTRRRR